MDILHDLRSVRAVTTPRPRPVNKRVWASLEVEPKKVIAEAFAEGLRRDPDRKRRWVVLVDGDRDQLRRVKRAVKKAGVDATIVLDLIHVLEYFWKAGSPALEQWVNQRLLALLQGRAAGAFAKDLRRWAARRALDKDKQKVVNDCIRYVSEEEVFPEVPSVLAEQGLGNGLQTRPSRRWSSSACAPCRANRFARACTSLVVCARPRRPRARRTNTTGLKWIRRQEESGSGARARLSFVAAPARNGRFHRLSPSMRGGPRVTRYRRMPGGTAVSRRSILVFFERLGLAAVQAHPIWSGGCR